MQAPAPRQRLCVVIYCSSIVLRVIASAYICMHVISYAFKKRWLFWVFKKSSGFFRFWSVFNAATVSHREFQFVYFGYTILVVVKACFTTILGVVACQNAVHYYHFGITSENLSPIYYYHFGIDILYIAIGYAFYLAALLVFHSNEKEYILGCLKLAPLRTVIKPDAVNSSICRLSVCSAIPYFFAAESGNTNSRWPPLSIDMH